MNEATVVRAPRLLRLSINGRRISKGATLGMRREDREAILQVMLKAGLPRQRFHDLRHSAASIMIRMVPRSER